jgi:hypothetical protein
MGLALFVLTAVTARFAYPAVSMEREAFWLVKASPLSIRTFLWIKFFIYYFPLLILTEVLIVATNILLQVTPFMMTLSTLTVFFTVPGIVSRLPGFQSRKSDPDDNQFRRIGLYDLLRRIHRPGRSHRGRSGLQSFYGRHPQQSHQPFRLDLDFRLIYPGTDSQRAGNIPADAIW